MRPKSTKTLKLIIIHGIPTIIQSLDGDEFYNLQRKHNRLVFGRSGYVMDTTAFMGELTFKCLLSPAFESAEELRKHLAPGKLIDLQNEICKINGFEVD